MTDGLRLTRQERTRSFALKLAGGLGPTLVLVGVAALAGGKAVAVAIAVLGVLCGLVVVTSARTVRGAALAGIVVAALLLLLQIVLAWFITHPIGGS
jgi:hypothetical protein